MPFVRVSRDKRGYETIYLVHTAQRRGRSGATRVLYVFRTPPGVKVGRDPFDAELRRTLEAQYPGVEFDWTKLSNIPPPPPDVEHWRERRRAEKAARIARRAEEADESPAEGEAADSAEAPEAEGGTPRGTDLPVPVVSPGADTVSNAPSAAAATTPAEGTPDARSGRRRRRRRGGRNRVETGAPAPEPPGPADSHGPSPEREDPGGGDGKDVA